MAHPSGLPAMQNLEASTGATKSAGLPSLNVSIDDNSADATMLGFEEETDELGQLSGDLSGSLRKVGPSSPPTSTISALSVSKLTPAERREHSRKHSRMHSRNLSAFFPRPGTEAENEADVLRASDTFRGQQRHCDEELPLGAIDTNNVGAQPNSSRSDLGRNSGGLQPTKSRRGHHRKHSVTHNIYARDVPITSADTSFDTHSGYSSRQTSSATTEPRIASATLDEKDYRPRPAAHAYDRHHRSTSATGVAKLLSTPVSQIVAASSLPPSYRPLLVFGFCQFVLGAALWASGQSGDSLAMLGLGYLVVFDAFGILNAVAGEWLAAKWRLEQDTGKLLRTPYGPHRVETLLHFTQTIFLLFASIYVCKESIEHALLEGTEEHHEHHDEDDIGLRLPQVLVLVTTLACAFSSIVLQNHSKLVAACGISTAASETSSIGARLSRGHGRSASVLVDPATMAGPFLQLFANPFGLMILFFSSTLSFACIAMPPVQVAALDKVLASLESAAMLYVAYPASKALGKILLQTAPAGHHTQNVQLSRSLQTIQEHKLVTYVAPPNLWQLTPPTSATRTAGGSSSAQGSRGLFGDSSALLTGGAGDAKSRVAKNPTLIASVEVFVRNDASDADVLDITGWSWRLLAPAVGAGAGLPAGESLRGGLRAGEIVVQVSREAEREMQRRLALAKFEHARIHDHSSKHNHDHTCQSNHAHDHDHHDHDHHGHDHHHHHHEHEHTQDLVQKDAERRDGGICGESEHHHNHPPHADASRTPIQGQHHHHHHHHS